MFSKAAGVSPNPVWEYKGGGVCTGGPTPGKECFTQVTCGTGGACTFHSGICGFQTARADGDASPWFQNGGAGIWHTGDADPTTPGINSNACDNYPFPNDTNTPQFTELYLDILESPIVAKVHQVPDTRNFPYTVEFQRLGFNLNMQTRDYAGGNINLDNDIDNDEANCLLCQYIYGIRFPSIYETAVFNLYENGVDPKSDMPQRSFGPLTDTDFSFAQNQRQPPQQQSDPGGQARLHAVPAPSRAADLRPRCRQPEPGDAVPGVRNEHRRRSGAQLGHEPPGL
ncbi:MAG: hypothetical protein DMF51_06015 [Acidobacteria bacterium]|nr:MAG: hypothetical protein DMF51_06015 [Acidobacteriota bacterium]